MQLFLLRTLWRILIFGGGAAVIYFVTKETFTYTREELNIFVAILVVYCVLAYGVIPLLFRLYHVVFKHDHIPLYATTRDGWASDPVNLAIIAKNQDQIEKYFTEAGWYKADPPTLLNSLREGASIALNMTYPNAPVSTLYLFNRKHDLAFQIPTNDKLSARTRHHLRLWRLEAPVDKHNDHNHFEFWTAKLFKWLHDDREVWIAACTEDIHPIGIRHRTGTITHRISHNDEEERDYVIQTLCDAGLVKSVDTTEPGENFRFRGQQFGTFITDGSVKITYLK